MLIFASGSNPKVSCERQRVDECPLAHARSYVPIKHAGLKGGARCPPRAVRVPLAPSAWGTTRSTSNFLLAFLFLLAISFAPAATVPAPVTLRWLGDAAPSAPNGVTWGVPWP